MAVDVVVTVFLGTIMGGWAIGAVWLGPSSKLGEACRHELGISITIFLLANFYCWLFRKGPPASPWGFRVASYLLGALYFVFLVLNVCYTIFLCWAVATSPQDGTNPWLLIGRLADTVLVVYLFHITWMVCWRRLTLEEEDSADSLHESLDQPKLAQDSPEARLLSRTYSEVRGLGQRQVEILIGGRSHLFVRVPLLPQERGLIEGNFTSRAEGHQTEEFCPVCQTKFELGQPLTCIGCVHRFHFSCLTGWMAGRVNCPMCRREYRKDLLHHAANLPN